KKVFKLQFPVGEFDMVVWDPRDLTCSIYEVKYSTEQVPEQYRHLINEEKCSMTSHRYGDITGKYVIYRGEPAEDGDVQYLNVEDYLKSLGKS
ncbi:MAG: ATP-binding protein, partial [Lachnospiraceae bacterium]|nr:ATP-binding protein [Lachnospiraceae bacterium]